MTVKEKDKALPGADTTTASDLAAERASILASIRGDTPPPMVHLRQAPVDTNAVTDAIDPIRAALEQKYAFAAAAAQTGVNEALLDNPTSSDFIYSSPKQDAAKQARWNARQRAAIEFNRSLAPDDPRRKDVIPSPMYGI